MLYPSLLWRMDVREKTLFLTFDDGPVEGPTDFVLEQLSRRNLHATFFCIGDNVRKHPKQFASILAGGHVVGNHTFNHLNGWKTPAEKYVANAASFDEIAKSSGLQEEVRLFRPPYGRISRHQIRMLDKYRIVMWDVLTQDYRHSLSVENCLRGTISACRPGSIIVFHDSHKARRNLEYTLPRLIDHFGDLGYNFKVIRPH